MLTGLKLQWFSFRHVIFVCGHNEIWNSELRYGFMQVIETQIFSVTLCDI